MIWSRTSGVAHRRKDRRISALLLWLLVIAGTASAQELPTSQFTDIGDQDEAITSGAFPADARNLFAGIRTAERNLLGPLPHAPLSLPGMDSLALATDDEVPDSASRRLLDHAFRQPAEPHPEPTRTGFKALVFQTGSDFNAFPRRRSTWVILAMGGAAAALAYPVDDHVNARLAGSGGVERLFAPGKYVGNAYVQIGAATSLYAIGRYLLPHVDGDPKTNKVSHLGFDLIRTLIVSQSLTQGIKRVGRRDRPTGECCAFPSGHASATFAVASVLERHLGYRGAWPTFVVAAYVATSRLYDNRHFLSDVLFGGALGVASGWAVVGRHGRSSYALMPLPVRGGAMVSLTRKPSS
jgi:membrane-associated phospholipid phosphatase